MTEPQKAAEVKGTLERKAIEWRQENFAITDLWTDERVADFARDVLEEVAGRAANMHGDSCIKVAARIRQMKEGR